MPTCHHQSQWTRCCLCVWQLWQLLKKLFVFGGSPSPTIERSRHVYGILSLLRPRFRVPHRDGLRSRPGSKRYQTAETLCFQQSLISQIRIITSDPRFSTINVVSVLLVRETSGVATFLLLLSILVWYRFCGKHLFLDSCNSKNYLAVCSTSVVSMYSIVMKNATDMTCLIYLLSKCLKELQERNRSQECKFKAHKIPSHWFVRFCNMPLSLTSAHLAWCARNAKPDKKKKKNIQENRCVWHVTSWIITLTQLEANPPELTVDFLRRPQKDKGLSQILKVRSSPHTHCIMSDFELDFWNWYWYLYYCIFHKAWKVKPWENQKQKGIL